MLSVLKEYIERVINEEIKQYPKGYYNDKQFRIPFEEYGNGDSYIEHYIDWIKAVSKKGTLPKPSVSFKEEVAKGIEKFYDNKKNHTSKDKLQDYMENKSTLFKVAKFDNNGNLYVERQIGVKIDNMHQESPTLFNELTQSYNNTVGGCWAFREGKGSAYCSDYDANFYITFKGYMFLDDIYWEELIRLEMRMNGEVEVRTYPNGRVQLEEIELFDRKRNTKVTLTAKDFDGPRIINSTFLGNKTTFNGDFAKLGYENIGYEYKLIDREGNLYKDVAPIVLKELESGKKIEDIVDDIIYFGNGLGKVCYYKRYNFIDKQGNLLSPNQWFDECYGFHDGFAMVELNNKYNLIDKQGNYLSPNQWFDECYPFEEGFGIVKLNNKRNFIDTEGNILSPNQWFDICWPFEHGVARVKLNNKYNLIDTQGNLLFPKQWLDRCGDFNDGVAEVKLNKEFNFIDKQGNLLSPNQWFNFCGDFNNGVAEVMLKGKHNWIDKQGNYLSPNQWFDDCDIRFIDGFARVELDGKENFIDTQGNILSPNQWFDACYYFGNGLAKVELNDKENWINKEGKLLSPNQWFDGCGPFSGGLADVLINHKWYKIDRDGNFYDEKTKQSIPNPFQQNESLRRTNQQLTEARFRNYLNELVREMMIR